MSLDPDSTTKTMKRPFQEGEDVLFSGADGLMYFGIVVEVDHDTSQCLVRFGDCTEKWSPFYDLRRLGNDDEEEEDEESSTLRNNDDDDDEKLPLLTKVKEEIVEEETIIQSTTNNSRKPTKTVIKREERQLLPQHVLDARKELPYDFGSLTWDTAHQRNLQERYCYCGESGDWYKKMLQCQKCLQWFHQECIRTMTCSLLFGDRFWNFVCTLCTGTAEEVIQKLDLNWAEALHLVLFNLTVVNNKKYHDLETSILGFIRQKWKYLVGPGCILSKSKASPAFLANILNSNKSRFKCGSEIKKRSTFWGLRKVSPPVVPSRHNGSCSNVDINYKIKCERLESLPANSRRQRNRRPPPPAPPAMKFGQQRQQRQSNNHRERRGRRPRDSMDSSSDASSSKGTLDAYIPIPKDFEGYNNPFRVINDDDEDAFDSFFLPPPCKASKSSSPSDPPTTPTEMPPPLKLFDKRKSTSSILSSSSSSSLKAGCSTTDDGTATTFLNDLKSSLNSYFGAETRMSRGEKFKVAAKRLTLDG